MFPHESKQPIVRRRIGFHFLGERDGSRGRTQNDDMQGGARTVVGAGHEFGEQMSEQLHREQGAEERTVDRFQVQDRGSEGGHRGRDQCRQDHSVRCPFPVTADMRPECDPHRDSEDSRTDQ